MSEDLIDAEFTEIGKASETKSAEKPAETGKAISTKVAAPIEIVRVDLEKMAPQFKLALPSHVSPEKFMRVVMTGLQNSPDLLSADRKSLYSACMKAAQDGLLPDGREGALVVYRGKDGPKVQWLPMTAGILKKIRNSGDLSSITAQIIHKNDAFRYWVDDEGEHITHEPLLFGDQGETIGVYALAKTKDGSVHIEVMTEQQIQSVKGISKAKDFGPWSGPFADEMRKKTAIRRLSKRLPMSTDLDDVIRRDDDLYDLTKQHEVDPSLPGKNQRKQLDEKYGAKGMELLSTSKDEAGERE
jgi:recombination protein RecT